MLFAGHRTLWRVATGGQRYTSSLSLQSLTYKCFPEDKSRFPFESPFETFFAVEQTARLKLTPTKYELSAEERPLWEHLQKAQACYFLLFQTLN